MSEKMKQFEFKEGEWVVTGWAEGQMETEREDDRGNKVTVMQPYYQLVALQLLQVRKLRCQRLEGREAQMRLQCRVEGSSPDGCGQPVL